MSHQIDDKKPHAVVQPDDSFVGVVSATLPIDSEDDDDA